ncbi:MAG: hypothetical protein HY511_02180, partial [Actinobacteria bacterium]|nr:hypothetical protein [Actinomycetota bacterium]
MGPRRRRGPRLELGPRSRHNGRGGFVQLDLTNPASPVFKGRTVYGPEADGDAHSAQYDEDRKLLFTADEDFCKASGAGIEKGFGYMRVYDVSKPSAPKQ